MGNSNRGQPRAAKLHNEHEDDDAPIHNEVDAFAPQILPDDAAKPKVIVSSPTSAKKVVEEWTWEIIGTMDFMELPAEVIDLIFSFMSAKQLGKSGLKNIIRIF